MIALSCLAFAFGACWRRWLGEVDTGRRVVKVAVFVAAAWLLFRWDRPAAAVHAAWAMAYAGAALLPLVVAMNWLDARWSAARWALTALPGAVVLAADSHWLGAPAFVVAAVAAGLSWLALEKLPNRLLPAWRPFGVAALGGYTTYAECLAGGLVVGGLYASHLL